MRAFRACCACCGGPRRGVNLTQKMDTILTAVQLLLLSAQSTAVRVESSPAAVDGLIRVDAGRPVSLTCLLEITSAADEELQWFRNEMPVSLQEGNRQNRSSLCLSPVSADDDGVTFKCQLRSNGSVSTSVQLEVFFFPELSGVDNVTVEEDGEISFVCDTYAKPQANVTWMFNGEVVDLGSGGYALFRNTWETRLSIYKVERHVHQGQYSCVVTSSKFGTRTKTFSLTVEGKKVKFPLGPIIAGLVVVFCTALLALVSRWKRITEVSALVRQHNHLVGIGVTLADDHPTLFISSPPPVLQVDRDAGSNHHAPLEWRSNRLPANIRQKRTDLFYYIYNQCAFRDRCEEISYTLTDSLKDTAILEGQET
ncbi:transmembrane and immunoglobulin domain-containing protein 1 [Arapaima gigas]